MNLIESTNRTWSNAVLAVGSAITGTAATTVVTPPADGTIVVSDYRIWNEHATTSTAVDILDGDTLIDSGPAAKDYGGFTHARNRMLVLTKGNALKVQCTVNSTSVRYYFSYTIVKGVNTR